MLENFESVVLTSVLRKKGIEIQTSLEEEKLLKRFYLLDLVSHIVNIVCHFLRTQQNVLNHQSFQCCNDHVSTKRFTEQ